MCFGSGNVMRTLLRASALLAIALVAAVNPTGPASAQQKITLRYAHVGAEGETQTLYATELAKLVAEKTQGRIVIQCLPGLPARQSERDGRRRAHRLDSNGPP